MFDENYMEHLSKIKIPEWVLKIKLADVASGKLLVIKSLKVLINCFKNGIIESPSDGSLYYKFGLIEGSQYTRISIGFDDEGRPNILRILSMNVDNESDNLYYRLCVNYEGKYPKGFEEKLQTELDEIHVLVLNLDW
jgi:hypothetical protein